jgi:ribonuclease P/MRP protein subunit RPP40
MKGRFGPVQQTFLSSLKVRWQLWTEEKLLTLYLDFAKAFDKVPHERLVKKIRAHGVCGKLLAWVKSWLSGRRQRSVLNGKFSTSATVLSEVPQGSVLGPLLFVIFINDIDESVKCVEIIKKFADDTKVGQKMTSLEDRGKLKQALDNLCQWADLWGMEFNIPKCKIMHLGPGNPPQVQHARSGVKETREEKDIGVTVTDNLRPTDQCARAAKMAQIVLGQISRAFRYRDRHMFARLYKQYAHHIWSSPPQHGCHGRRQTGNAWKRYRDGQ